MVTATVLNTKIKEVDKKIPDLCGLVKKKVKAKISQIQGKYYATFDYHKFMGAILNAKIKQKELVKKSNISNLVKNSALLISSMIKIIALKFDLESLH